MSMKTHLTVVSTHYCRYTCNTTAHELRNLKRMLHINKRIQLHCLAGLRAARDALVPRRDASLTTWSNPRPVTFAPRATLLVAPRSYSGNPNLIVSLVQSVWE